MKKLRPRRPAFDDDDLVIADTLTDADTLTQEVLSYSRRENKDERRLLQALGYFTTRLQEAKAVSKIEHVRIEDSVDLLREAENLDNGDTLKRIVSLVILHWRINGPLLLEKVAIESLGCVVECLIECHFQLVARGHFAWLLDIQMVGQAPSAVPKLVQESVRVGARSPADEFDKRGNLIRPNPHKEEIPSVPVKSEFHQRNCVHRGGTPSNQLQGLIDKPQDIEKDACNQEEMRCRVFQYCGLAGILPHWESGGHAAIRRQSKTAISILMFEEPVDTLALEEPGLRMHQAYTSLSANDTTTSDSDLSKPSLSPSSTSWAETDCLFHLTEAQTKHIHLLHHTIARFCIAADFLQRNHYCCNAFTLIISRENLDPQLPVVDMVRIMFQSLQDFRQSMFALWTQTVDKPSKIRLEDLKTCSSIGQNILSIFTHSQDPSDFFNDPIHDQYSVDCHLHVCSLAMQLLGLGIVFYTQGHKGPFSPPFLDHDLTEIELLGTGNDRISIKASLRELTCLGEMVGGPVFVFHLVSGSTASAASRDIPDVAVDFRCRGVDLIDTWGPGLFISKAGAPYGSQLYAIEIGGGVIKPVRSGSINHDPTKPLFHWSSQLESYNELRRLPMFSSQDEIQIGAIKINSACPLDSQKCRNSSSSQELLCNLGTQASYWELAERQVAFQAGYYTVLQVGNMYARKLGRTVKQQMIEQWSLLPNLRMLVVPWGLQISLCTGVAKRVSLRKLIEDSMFTHVDTLKYEQWHKMLPGARAAFQGSIDLKTYIEGLSSDEKICLIAIIGYILDLLKHTGVDHKGEYLSILWPDALSTSYGVKVQCNEKNAWTRILQDSESSATFAAITSTCFEGHDRACRNMITPPWQDYGGFLSTAVCHDLTAQRPMANAPSNLLHLKDGQRYWVGKVGGDFWVIVREANDGEMHLSVKCNRFPKMLSQKLVGRNVIRERPGVEFEAEDVIVLRE